MKLSYEILNLLPEVDPEEDPLKYYKMPLVSILYFKRLSTVLRCLGNFRYKLLLDLGYGSGILLPELKLRCEELYAIDKHNKSKIVKDVLDKKRINVNLCEADILNLPYNNEMFDCITCISVLDHIKEYSKAVEEIYRVLKKGGDFFVGLVRKSKISDIGFDILNAKTDIYHVNTDKEIFEAIEEKFKLEKTTPFLSFLPEKFAIYRCKKFKKIN